MTDSRIRKLRTTHIETLMSNKSLVGAEKDSIWSEITILLIAAFLVSTLVQSMIPFSLNRVFGGLLVAGFAYKFFSSFNRSKALLSFCIGLVFVHSCLVSTDISQEMTDFVYWVGTIFALVCLRIEENRRALLDAFSRHQSSLFLVVEVSAIFLTVLLFLGIGFKPSWGGELYFAGLCNTNHTMASVCCLIMCVTFVGAVLDSGKRGKAIVVLLVSTWALLQTGARAFLVPAMCIWFLLPFKVIDKMCARVFFGITALVIISLFLPTSVIAYNFI